MVAGAMMKETHKGWLEHVDNLFAALEVYREAENQALNKIKELLTEKGIELSEEEIRTSDFDSIRERLMQTREARLHEEQLQRGQEERKREEERSCRR
ncbi:MAG: hypothetical protein K2L07_12365 [Lachnospiraceae bacterium]|nr:hypothetical protein [Lachnospiraceae bacterium]